MTLSARGAVTTLLFGATVVTTAYLAVRFTTQLPYICAGLGAMAALNALVRKYGAAGLLILTAPIHRLAVEVGFALKAYYVVVVMLVVVALVTRRRPALATNRDFKLVTLFLFSILISAFANGVPDTAVRHLLVFVFVLSGCYFLYQSIRSAGDVDRLMRIYLFTGLVLGITGLMFYGLYFVRPDLVVKGSIFEGVTYEPDRPWTMPLLQSVDVGSNGYAMALLPFLFVSIGSMLTPGPARRKFYPAVVFMLLLLNLVLTFSRGGMISFILAFVLFVITMRGYRRLKWALGGMLVVMLISLVPQLENVYVEVSYLKGSYSGAGSDLLSTRPRLAMESLEIYAKNPVFGVGQGQIIEKRYVGKQAHNTFLELLAENGIITFTIFLALLWSLFRHVRYVYRNVGSGPMYYQISAFTFGTIALLIAAIPTSAITMTLLWLQFTVLVAMARVVRWRDGLKLALPHDDGIQ